MARSHSKSRRRVGGLFGHRLRLPAFGACETRMAMQGVLARTSPEGAERIPLHGGLATPSARDAYSTTRNSTQTPNSTMESLTDQDPIAPVSDANFLGLDGKNVLVTGGSSGIGQEIGRAHV